MIVKNWANTDLVNVLVITTLIWDLMTVSVDVTRNGAAAKEIAQSHANAEDLRTRKKRRKRKSRVHAGLEIHKV